MVRHVVRMVTVIAGVMALPAFGHAQIGSGWVEYKPVMSLQIRGCAAHEAAEGVERFRLNCADTSGDNRAEQRIENDYSTGTNQFEGEVRVVSVGANIIVKQTFMPNRGAFLMIAVSADGRLYIHGGGGDVASGVIGRWVRINTIHDVSAGTHQIYADGMLKVTKGGGGQVAWHDKFGSYRSQSGRGPVVVEWRNTRFWRGGRSTGGASPPTDAGVPDVAAEVAPPADAASSPDAASSDAGGGSGGATGRGGTSGTSGTGGATGTGGSRATGGAGGNGPRPPAAGGTGGGGPGPTPGAGESSGCGCTVGGATRSESGLALFGLLLAGVVLSRASRPSSRRVCGNRCDRSR